MTRIVTISNKRKRKAINKYANVTDCLAYCLRLFQSFFKVCFLLKAFPYFSLYSEGFIPNNLENWSRKYLMSLNPAAKAASLMLWLVVMSSRATLRNRINRMNSLADLPDMDLIRL